MFNQESNKMGMLVVAAVEGSTHPLRIDVFTSIQHYHCICCGNTVSFPGKYEGSLKSAGPTHYVSIGGRSIGTFNCKCKIVEASGWCCESAAKRAPTVSIVLDDPVKRNVAGRRRPIVP